MSIKTRYFFLIIIYGSKPQIWGEGIMDIESVFKKYSAENESLGLGGHLGGTDTKVAFELAAEYLKRAVQDTRFRESFPPLVLHLTDGLSHTNAEPVCQAIRQLSTSDGQVLVANAFIGTETNLQYKGPEDFSGYTTADEAGPSKDNIRLFNMSSPVPPSMYENLRADGIFPNLSPESHLFFDVRTKDMLKNVIQVVGSIGSRADRTER